MGGRMKMLRTVVTIVAALLGSVFGFARNGMQLGMESSMGPGMEPEAGWV